MPIDESTNIAAVFMRCLHMANGEAEHMKGLLKTLGGIASEFLGYNVVTTFDDDMNIAFWKVDASGQPDKDNWIALSEVFTAMRQVNRKCVFNF